MTEVVDIRFSFHNRMILKLLAKRAKAIQNLDTEKKAKIESKMTWYKNINLYFNELRTPSAFYCIFENSKASQALNKHKSITLFDKKI